MQVKQKSSLIVAVGIPLSAATGLHFVVTLMACGKSPAPDPWGFRLWWLCLGGTVLVLRLVLRKPREQWTVAAICGGGLILQTVLTLLSPASYSSLFSYLAVFGMWALSYFACGWTALRCPKAETLMYLFEISLGVFVAACIMVSAKILPASSSTVCFAGMLLALFALAGYRQTGTANRRGGLLRVGLVAGAGGLSALLTGLTTGLFGLVLGNAVRWGRSLLSAIGVAITSFMTWLVALLPEESLELTEELSLGTGEIRGTDTSVLSQDTKSVIMVVAICLILAAAAVGLLLWLRWSGCRKTGRSAKAGGVSVRRSGEKKNYLLLWLRHRTWYWKNRNTPAGILVWLDGAMRRRGMGRVAGESSRAFLERVGKSNPNAGEGLTELARWLDCHYFARERPAPLQGKISGLRRTLRQSFAAEPIDKRSEKEYNLK